MNGIKLSQQARERFLTTGRLRAVTFDRGRLATIRRNARISATAVRTAAGGHAAHVHVRLSQLRAKPSSTKLSTRNLH